MKNVALLCFLMILLMPLQAQDTFSIVAVDPETGEVGSAGASCVVGAGTFGGVILLSGIIPGRGGINAQAWICINPHINLDNAMDRMEEGLSPGEIIDWLMLNDDCFSQNFDPSYRQYGIVDLDTEGAPRSAAFTGSNTDDWKGQITGATYSIQGNILKGPEVLDSMEARFLAADGSLAEKLMAAMQGANMVGADARCTDQGTSSTSAFLRVFRPDDSPDNPYLQLNVAETPAGVEPIDSLQSLFDSWLLSPVSDPEISTLAVNVFPNPVRDIIQLSLRSPLPSGALTVSLTDPTGRVLLQESLNRPNTELRVPQGAMSGVLILQIKDASRKLLFTDKIIIIDRD